MVSPDYDGWASPRNTRERGTDIIRPPLPLLRRSVLLLGFLSLALFAAEFLVGVVLAPAAAFDDHQLTEPFDGLMGRGQHAGDDGLDLRSRGRAQGYLLARRLFQERGVLHHVVEGLAQRSDAIGRDRRRHEVGEADFRPGHRHFHGALVDRRFGEVDGGRDIGPCRLPLHAELDDRAEQMLGQVLRLHRLEGQIGKAAEAVDLAALHGEKHLPTAGIAVHHLEFGAEHVVHDGRIDRGVRGRSGAADHGRISTRVLDVADLRFRLVPDADHRVRSKQPAETDDLAAHRT